MTLQLPTPRAPFDIDPGDIVQACDPCRYPAEAHASPWIMEVDPIPGSLIVTDRCLDAFGWPLLAVAGHPGEWFCMGCFTKGDVAELAEQERVLTADPDKLPAWAHLRVFEA